MTASVGVGVVGLGRRWRRLSPALHRLRRRLAVRAVCDQVAGRAEREARRLGCAAAAGPVDLLEREDVEALVLLDRQWYGLWPLERACAAGKPVFCAFPVPADGQADAVRARVEEAGLPVMMAPGRWGLLHPRGQTGLEGVGTPDLVRAEGAVRGEARLDSPALSALLEAAAAWCGAEPCALWADEGRGFASVVLEFPDGRRGQVTLTEDPLGRRGCRLWLMTGKGTVELASPRRLSWRDRAGRHERPLRGDAGGLAGQLARFARAVRSGGAMEPSLANACGVLAWQRAAQVSNREGRRVPLGGEGGDSPG